MNQARNVYNIQASAKWLDVDILKLQMKELPISLTTLYLYFPFILLLFFNFVQVKDVENALFESYKAHPKVYCLPVKVRRNTACSLVITRFISIHRNVLTMNFLCRKQLRATLTHLRRN